MIWPFREGFIFTKLRENKPSRKFPNLQYTPPSHTMGATAIQQQNHHLRTYITLSHQGGLKHILLLNPFKPNGIFRPYQFDQSISVLRVAE